MKGPHCEYGFREPSACPMCSLPRPDQTRPRDVPHEHHLTRMAAGPGFEVPAELLSRFADKRALAGGVRVELDGDREAVEEIADARNYLVWEIQNSDDAERNRLRMDALGLLAQLFNLLERA